MDAREKKLFCRKTGVSYSHCSQLANGIGRADINTMRKMCNADSRVKPRDLRPDLPV